MRKIILFLILLFFSSKVKAQIYYSNYSEFKEIDKIIEETDLIKLKIENKYLIYKEDKIEAFYPSYMEVNQMIKTDETKIITSDWLNEKPTIMKDRNIIEKQLYEYQDMKEIRYIKLNKLISTNGNLNISEIRIFNKSNKVDYKIISNQTSDKIHNDNLNDYNSFNEYDELLIDLCENVDITDLRMMYYIYADINTEIYITIDLLGEEKKNIYVTKTLYSILDTKNNHSFSYLIDQDHFDVKEPSYQEIKLSEQEILKTKFNSVKQVIKYKTEDLYFKYYRIEKEYLKDYYLEPIENYYLDLNSKKAFYYIKKRDLVEIKDRLIIDNYNIKLEDFILNKTIDDIKITSNINYKRNGEYDINFILPFKVVKKKVIVDIKENYINALKEQNNLLSDLEKENKNLFIYNNNLNVKLKETMIDKDKLVNEKNEQIIKYKYENEHLKLSKKDLEETKDGSNFNNKKIWIVIGIFSLVFLTIILRKKST